MGNQQRASWLTLTQEILELFLTELLEVVDGNFMLE